MPVHDWTRVEAGVFHSFHGSWITHLQEGLNGLLTGGYYALSEQHAGKAIGDVITLHASPAQLEPLPLPPATGGIAVAESPPKVSRRQRIEKSQFARQRTLVIRHVSDHRLIALLEIVSPANKDRVKHVDEFVTKAVSALDLGVHFFLVDLLPPGRYDPQGLHGAIQQQLKDSDEVYDLPANTPLTIASYAADTPIDIAIEHCAVGETLSAEMPLYLRPDRYVKVPLEPTYMSAYQGMPEFWRHVVEGNALSDSSSYVTGPAARTSALTPAS